MDVVGFLWMPLDTFGWYWMQWMPLDAIWTDSSRGIPMINHMVEWNRHWWITWTGWRQLVTMIFIWKLVEFEFKKDFQDYASISQSSPFIFPFNWFRNWFRNWFSSFIGRHKTPLSPDVIRLIGANLSLVKPLKCSLSLWRGLWCLRSGVELGDEDENTRGCRTCIAGACQKLALFCFWIFGEFFLRLD